MKAAIVLLATVLLIAGCGGQDTTESQTETESDAAMSSTEPVRYEIEVGTEGFTPAEVHAHVGQEVTLVFTRITEETCGTEILIPSRGIEEDLPLDEPVEITLVPEEKGEIRYACGMNMLLGKIVVN